MDIVIRKSNINGKGIFAGKNFKRGSIVLQWKPKILTEKQLLDLSSDQKHYCIKEKKDIYLLMQAPEKFVNHSCRPNTKVKSRCDVAIKDILIGEEITSNYGSHILAPFNCSCGNKNCRKIIQ